jgi:hypothetical protein
MRIKFTLASFSILLLSSFIALPAQLNIVAQVDEKEKEQKEDVKRGVGAQTLALLDKQSPPHGVCCRESRAGFDKCGGLA